MAKLAPPPLRTNPLSGAEFARVWQRWLQKATVEINDRTSRVIPGLENNLVSLDANGDLQDSGIDKADVIEPADILGTTDKIDVTDNGDGTVTLALNAVFLSTILLDILGTTNQIIATDNGDQTITLSTPQDLHAAADVIFNDITVNGDLLGLGGFTGDLNDSTTTKIADVVNGLITAVAFAQPQTLAGNYYYKHKSYRIADGLGVIEY